MRKLGIHSQLAVGLREISALTVRRGPDGTSRLLAAGDEAFAVASVEIGDDGRLGRVRRADLRPAVREAGVGTGSGSGFEGIASDGDGTLVLLQEEQARLLVFAPDLARLLHVVTLAVPYDDPELNPVWRREPNSRGEGLLLLDGGHVLIAKERDDPCLIEFGPRGDAAVGVGPETVLAPTARFRPPGGPEPEIVPLAVWPLTGDTARVLPSINDLARGPDGRLYALSADTQVVARLERRLDAGERVHAAETWQIDPGLPGGRSARPEGLTFLPSGRPVVAIDTKHGGNDVAVLQRLDEG